MNGTHQLEPSESAAAPLPGRRRRRDVRQTCGLLCQAIGRLLALVSVVHWVPGLGFVLLLVLGWFLPAAAILGGLMLVQWPLFCWLSYHQRDRRKKARELRRAFAFPTFPPHLPASRKLRPPR